MNFDITNEYIIDIQLNINHDSGPLMKKSDINKKPDITDLSGKLIKRN